MSGTDEGLVADVELGAVRPKDLEIDVAVNDRTVHIHGLRTDNRPFESSIEVPPIFDLEKASATFEKGVLRVQVPLSARTR